MKEPIDISGHARGAFLLALHDAEKGNKIVYWIGQHCGGPHRLDAAAACEAGLCLLFCKKYGEELFAYLAVKK